MAQQEFADFEIQTDFTSIPEMSGEFQALPIGDYVFDVSHLEQAPSKANNPMIKVQFTVAEADAQIEEGARAFAGQRAFGQYSLLPQALGRLKTLMVACNASLGSFKASEVMGARFVGTIVHREGQPQPDQNGNLLPAKVFANVVNERSLESATAAAEPEAPPPPVTKATKAATNGKAASTQARRA